MKKIILTIVLFTFLVGGGIWLGIYKSKINLTPTALVIVNATDVQNIKNQTLDDKNMLSEEIYFIVNNKNIVLGFNFKNEDSNKGEHNSKLIAEATKIFVQQKIDKNKQNDIDTINISVDIMSGNYSQIKNIELSIYKLLNKTFKNKIDINFNIYANISNSFAKYKQIIKDFDITEELNNSSEEQILALVNNKFSEMNKKLENKE